MRKEKYRQQVRNREQFPGCASKRVTMVGLALALLLGLGHFVGDRAVGAEAAKKRRPVEFRADHMSGKDDVWTLKDNVVFLEKDEEITLKADQAVYWSKEDRAEITGNISVSGMFLITSDPLPEKTKLKLQFQVPGDSEKVQVIGEVLWCREQKERPPHFPGMGIRFVGISDQHRIIIDRFIKELLEKDK